MKMKNFLSKTLIIACLFLSSIANAQDPLIGEIKMFAGNFAPRGWAFCDGQLLPISQNSALFSILGTTYGGDGRTTFGLPDLRGRVAIHPGNGPGLSNYNLGQAGGQETVTLTTAQLPSHSHTVNATSESGDTNAPSGGLLSNTGAYDNEYKASGTVVPMKSNMINNTGGSQPVQIRQPYRTVNYIIALIGIYPSRS